MMFSRRTGNKTIRIFKQKRVFIMSALCAILVISLVTRPASAAVAFRTSSTIGNSAATTSLSVAMPTGTLVNDVMIAILSVRGGSGVTVTHPLGWTLINTANTITTPTTMKSSTYYKVAGVSEAGPYVFSFTSGLASLSVSSYSGVDTAAPIDAQAVQAYAASLTLTAPTVTTTVANAMLVAMYSTARGAVTLTAGSGMTIRSQVSSTGTAVNSTTTGSQDAAQAVAGISGTKTMTANGTAALNVGHLIALRPAPVVSQANYRFFQNTDSTTASTPYAVAGSPAAISGSTPFRLRLNLGVASGSTTVTNAALRTYTLQYALRGGDNTCDTSFSGETYADVGPATTVQFYNNATPADGAAYVTSANDPTRASITAVGQKYEESNPLVVGTTTPANQDMLWDISLTTSGVSIGQTYCMRVLDSNNSSNLSNGYTVIPEFTIPTPTVRQANYRWFANADNITPGAPLATQDTIASVVSQTPLRLRQLLAVNISDIPINYKNYKLQYAQKVSSCDPGVSGETYYDAAGMPTTSAKTPASTDITSDTSGVTVWAGSGTLQFADGLEIRTTTKALNAASHYAIATNFGFAIPSTATINGIGVNATRRSQMVSFTNVAEKSIKLVKGGIISGNDKNRNISWDNASGPWGSSTDMWGLPLTPADINATNFGVAFKVILSSDGVNLIYAYADDVTITVYYTDPSGNPMVAYSTNGSVSSGGTIGTKTGDPTDAARPTVYQSYRSDDPFSNNVSAISNGSDGLWDFSLKTNTSAEGKTLCFRVVDTSNGTLSSYLQYPQLTVTASGPSLDQQLRGGQSVLNGVKQPSSW